MSAARFTWLIGAVVIGISFPNSFDPSLENNQSISIFKDEFDGVALDSGKWNTDVVTSGVRWCTPELVPPLQFTSPGEWIDPSVDPCLGMAVSPPYGAVGISGGLASFSAGTIGAFPYIWSGPPSRPSPFPSSSDFTLTVRMRYDDTTDHGNGLQVVYWEDSSPAGDNPPIPAGQGVFGIWSTGVGLLGDSTSVTNPFEFHEYSLTYSSGEYTVLVDGAVVLGPTASSVRPNAIWVGNPIITRWGLHDWSDFTVDFIEVALPEPPSPTCEVDQIVIDDSISNEVVSGEVSGTSACEAVLEFINERSWWVNYSIVTTGGVEISPAGGADHFYHQHKILGPQESVHYVANFASPGQTVIVMMDPTIVTGEKARIMNLVESIVDLASLKVPGASLTWRLVVEFYPDIRDAFGAMPHLDEASKALFSNPPNIPKVLKELRSSSKAGELATLGETLEELQYESGEEIFTSLGKKVGHLFGVLRLIVERYGNLYRFIFEYPAGAIVFTAE